MNRQLLLALCIPVALVLGLGVGIWYGYRVWGPEPPWRPTRQARAGEYPKRIGTVAATGTPQHPIYRLSTEPEPNVLGGDNADLRWRLRRFFEGDMQVSAAACYDEGVTEDGVVDIYVTWNFDTHNGEIHMVRWNGATKGEEESADEYRVIPHLAKGMGGLLFLDIDGPGPGRRQVIISQTGGPLVLDFHRPPGREIVQDMAWDDPLRVAGSPWEWDFADIDGDGTYEVIEVGPVERGADDVMYAIHKWRNGKYVFQKTLRTDPTAGRK